MPLSLNTPTLTMFPYPKVTFLNTSTNGNESEPENTPSGMAVVVLPVSVPGPDSLDAALDA